MIIKCTQCDCNIIRTGRRQKYCRLCAVMIKHKHERENYHKRKLPKNLKTKIKIQKFSTRLYHAEVKVVSNQIIIKYIPNVK